jgi:hypothetical protein
MTTPTIAVQYRGGTTTEHEAFTGLLRELTIDTTKHTVVVHDGTTPGGFPLQKELVSGQTLKTLNSQSLLGEGNIVITLPVATDTTLGGVKVDGTTIAAEADGTLTVIGVGGSSANPAAFATFTLVNGELIINHSSSFTLSMVDGEFIVEYV